MNVATAVVNIAMGGAYVIIGSLVVIELVRGWKRWGPSPMGMALVAMAYTCGPAHLDHGIHLAVRSDQAASLDLLTVVAGLPAGWMFAMLRVEAFRGGRGERTVRGTPAWMALLPSAVVAHLAVLIAATSHTGRALSYDRALVPNVALVAVYAAIAAVLLRAQVGAHRETGEWSVSGLSLTGIFATCAPMHAATAFYVTSGRYAAGVHALTIGWASVPAGLYFLWVVRRLSTGQTHDWDAASPAVPAPTMAGV